MVIVGILGIFETIMHGVLSTLPSPSVPGLNSFATTLVGEGWFGHLAWANDYFPLDATLAAGLTVMGVWLGTFVVKVVIWSLTKFHILGGSE